MRGVLFHSKPARWLGVLLAVAVLVAAMPASLARADDATPTPGAGHAFGLARVYQAELAWLERQGEQMERAREALAKAKALAAAAEEEGKDTAALDAAVAAFELNIGLAQSAHDNAAAILEEHDGLDDEGNVVDQKAALATLKQARRAMLEAHHLTLRAVQALRKDVRGWRGQGRPEKPEDHPAQGSKPGLGLGRK